MNIQVEVHAKDFAVQRGQAIVEAAMVLPLILVLVLGVFAVGIVGRTDAALLAVSQEAAPSMPATFVPAAVFALMRQQESLSHSSRSLARAS